MPYVQASELRKGSHRLLPFRWEPAPPEVVAITLSLRALRGVRRLIGVVTICAELHGVPATTAVTMASVAAVSARCWEDSPELQQRTGNLLPHQHRTSQWPVAQDPAQLGWPAWRS